MARAVAGVSSQVFLRCEAVSNVHDVEAGQWPYKRNSLFARRSRDEQRWSSAAKDGDRSLASVTQSNFPVLWRSASIEEPQRLQFISLLINDHLHHEAGVGVCAN